ncbi:MAG TPA: 3-methyl-2-oxobutanoate dehydrogenase subunit VorB [Candidatus Desulfofervidus auxilii]|uniref:3-methyl-2-oxobutanoate dehydrogenase subunit VorB n=1 Tax=Desulfofervidus auxilii TaxID=1621989 RepID=A0A7V0I9Q5_DESA2|nr:3-methyl-2-oxobutanoate dehydrogenase subunit VorB [Candidatus Desulfofervidus auxilii]
MDRWYLTGNEAIVEGALRAGLNAFFSYPITPANEIIETFAKKYFEDRERERRGEKPFYPEFKVFLQMESEIASINAVMGGAAAGFRVMTSSSSPGISLKTEGISYLAACELPCVIVNIMRGGPGLGSIQPEQSDYFQAVKGGGHGDYKLIVLAPSSAKEMFEYTIMLFNLTDKYRNPGMLLADGYLGQMKESFEVPDVKIEKYEKPWAVTGMGDRETQNVIESLYLIPEPMIEAKKRLFEKYKQIEANEVRYETYKADDAKILIAAYGTCSRVAKEAIDIARENGIKVGLIRPITLWPFPYKIFVDFTTHQVDRILVVEMSFGQFVEDVRLGVEGRAEVKLFACYGGILPTEEEILKKIREFS